MMNSGFVALLLLSPPGPVVPAHPADTVTEDDARSSGPVALGAAVGTGAALLATLPLGAGAVLCGASSVAFTNLECFQGGGSFFLVTPWMVAGAAAALVTVVPVAATVAAVLVADGPPVARATLGATVYAATLGTAVVGVSAAFVGALYAAATFAWIASPTPFGKTPSFIAVSAVGGTATVAGAALLTGVAAAAGAGGSALADGLWGETE